MELNFSAPATTKGYEKQQTKEVSKRRTTACVSYTQQYLYRRGFSEANLLEAMKLEKFEKGQSWNFITGGDVDNLSYLKVILLHQPQLDYVLFSTWRMAAEDLLQLGEWLDNGVIKKMDAYLGEIFPSTHHVEWQMINELFDRTQCGRIAVFRNHSKIIAGWGGAISLYDRKFCQYQHQPANRTGLHHHRRGCYAVLQGILRRNKKFLLNGTKRRGYCQD